VTNETPHPRDAVIARNREVFFFGINCGSPLLCVNVRRDGPSIRGAVVNGGWRMLYDGQFLYAYSGRALVTKTESTLIKCVAIPEKMRGGYNELIYWARQQ